MILESSKVLHNGGGGLLLIVLGWKSLEKITYLGYLIYISGHWQVPAAQRAARRAAPARRAGTAIEARRAEIAPHLPAHYIKI